jgi:cytoskeletal protein CcmA (bactofilin family)
MSVTTSSELFQATQQPANDAPLVIGAKATVLGCLSFEGDVIIHGDIDGEVRAEAVIIAAGANFSGTIIAAEVVVEGTVSNAWIFADRIILRDQSQTTGEIWHKELTLEAGHLFEGKSRRHNDPRSLAPVEAEHPD